MTRFYESLTHNVKVFNDGSFSEDATFLVSSLEAYSWTLLSIR